MKTTALSHCAAAPACRTTAPRSLPARLKQLTLTAAAALALVLAPVASAATSTFTVLQNLDYSTTGGSPSAGLVQGTDGALYGTTQQGGSGAVGTVFKLNPDGSGFTVLQSLDLYTTGGYPAVGLVQGTDGALYGTTSQGGTGGYYGAGTVFKLNPDGSGFTLLRDLDYYSGDGYPVSKLVQGTDGALYGTTSQGGSNYRGTVFKLNPDGSGFTVLLSFDWITTGGYPTAGLVQGTDGALYGTTQSGGSLYYGTVFKLNPDGSGFTVLKNFDYYLAGGYLHAGLVQGTDGALYGTTSQGGSGDRGTVFKLNPDGSGFTVLQNLDYDTTGANPSAGLVQGTDGALYGTTTQGGSFGGGTVFRLSAGPPAAPDLEVLTLTTTNNKAPQGQKVTVTAVVKNTGTAAAGASTT
ncbi:MAG: choice-of-anchor tandem repeat GloVer-containing protein, partial [Limisphaerales bacterium]